GWSIRCWSGCRPARCRPSRRTPPDRRTKDKVRRTKRMRGRSSFVLGTLSLVLFGRSSFVLGTLSLVLFAGCRHPNSQFVEMELRARENQLRETQEELQRTKM